MRSAAWQHGSESIKFCFACGGQNEHHKSSTRRVFTYVVGGRVGMNDTCYFTFDLKKLDPPARPPTHPPTTTTHPPLPHYSPTTTTQHQQQHQPLHLTRKTALDFTTTDFISKSLAQCGAIMSFLGGTIFFE